MALEVREINFQFANAVLYSAPELPFFAENLGISTDMDVFKHLISSIEDFNPEITECSRFVNKDKKDQRPLVVTFESRSDLSKLINSQISFLKTLESILMRLSYKENILLFSLK